jgi:hypothetical protein
MEHNRMLDKVRSEEKQRQYDNIAGLERRIADQQSEIETLKGQIKALTDSATPNSGVDVKKLIEDLTARAAELQEKASQGTRQQLEDLQKQVRSSELRAFKEKAIADAGGPSNLVVALVRGNTEEEITASVEEAKREFESMKLRFNPPPPATTPPANTESGRTTMPPSTSPAPVVAGGRGAGVDTVEGGNVRELTPKEYAEKRPAILRDLKNRYPARR